jgi:hypothetical protein
MPQGKARTKNGPATATDSDSLVRFCPGSLLNSIPLIDTENQQMPANNRPRRLSRYVTAFGQRVD